MSEFARLEEKLEKLRQRERAPGEARKLRGSDAETILAGIVTEIDETILPRKLTFSLDGDAKISLAVANRRLQALLSPAPKGLDAELADQELPDADDPRIAALASGLRAVLSGVENVTISSSRPKQQYPSDVGVPASQLERAWGIKTVISAPTAPQDVLRDFLQGIGEDAIAWLRIEGETVADQGGDASELAQLGEKAAIFLDGYFSKFDALFPEPSLSCGTVVSPGTNKDRALLFIEIGELSAFISAKPGGVLALAGRWQKMVAE